jgi:hypothetical protein
MSVLAMWVLAAVHQVEETEHRVVHLLFVRKPAVGVSKLAFAVGVEDTRVFAQVVRKFALVAEGAEVFEVHFSAGFLVGFGFDDLAFERVREEAVKAILAVSHIKVDAGVLNARHVMLTVGTGLKCAFFD